MLSALSPKYPALYDEESKVFFRNGKAEVTEEQAFALAKRRYVDGILIGEFDEEGRTVNAKPAKEWARDRGRTDDEPVADAPPLPEQPDAAEVADKKTRSK